VEAEMFGADRQTDRKDEVYRRFTEFRQRIWKRKVAYIGRQNEWWKG